MPEILRVDNFAPANVKEQTLLDADQVASASPVAMLVKSSQNIAVGDPIYIGARGMEGCELKRVSVVGDATHLTVPTLTYAHDRFDTIMAAYGDAIQVYRAPNVDGLAPASDDLYLPVGAAIAIDSDQSSTDITDPTGGSAWWYKYTYVDTVSGLQTPIADAVAVRGGGQLHYCEIDQIRDEAGFQANPYITDAMIALRRDDAEDEINGELVGMYTIPFTSPISPTIANITRLLAAGWLLAAEYGPTSSGTNKDAADKLKQARDMIAKVKSREIVLTNAIGDPQNTASGVSSWPNASTETTNTSMGGAHRKFRMGMDF